MAKRPKASPKKVLEETIRVNSNDKKNNKENCFDAGESCREVV